jgi:hypothetical protein
MWKFLASTHRELSLTLVQSQSVVKPYSFVLLLAQATGRQVFPGVGGPLLVCVFCGAALLVYWPWPFPVTWDMVCSDLDLLLKLCSHFNSLLIRVFTSCALID